MPTHKDYYIIVIWHFRHIGMHLVTSLFHFTVIYHSNEDKNIGATEINITECIITHLRLVNLGILSPRGNNICDFLSLWEARLRLISRWKKHIYEWLVLAETIFVTPLFLQKEYLWLICHYRKRIYDCFCLYRKHIYDLFRISESTSMTYFSLWKAYLWLFGIC